MPVGPLGGIQNCLITDNGSGIGSKGGVIFLEATTANVRTPIALARPERRGVHADPVRPGPHHAVSMR
jgi:hypothetical protein